jgi:hypothetical protein
MSNEIVVIEPEIRLGSLSVMHPSDMIGRASEIATALAKVVKDRKLSRNISGREYVYVEGWATMGAMIGVLPREVQDATQELENGDFIAAVELIRVNDGAVVGFGSAIVGYDENTWKSRPRYAKRSMAITRATGKAYRLGFSWIMALAGYAPTPAEEMDGMDERYQPNMTPSPANEIKVVKPPAPAPVETGDPAQVQPQVDAWEATKQAKGEQPVQSEQEAPVDPITTIEQAEAEISDTEHIPYGMIATEALVNRANSLAAVKNRDNGQIRKLGALRIIIKARRNGRPVMSGHA